MKNNSAIWNEYTTICRISPSSIRIVDWALTNIPNFSLVKIGHIVPAPEIKEICRLHNKIYTDYDFFDQ
jgi:hypothetical protein